MMTAVAATPADTNSPFATPSEADPDLEVTEAPKPPKHERPRCGWFRWVPTDRQQLANTEACILFHLRHRKVQRFVAGLNTVSSLPPRPGNASPTAMNVSAPAAPAAPAGSRAAANGANGASTTVATGGAAPAAASTTAPAVPPPRPIAPQVERHIVFLHGFGGGLGVWVPNLNDIIARAQQQNETIQLHAIDMPGFARSDRHPMVSFDNEREAIDYMVGHLHSWFVAMGLTRTLTTTGRRPHVDLVGHSFGGYVSSCFAARHPALVDRIVLCDPWGVPTKPEKIELARRHRAIMGLFYMGNPFSVLRGAGPLGPSLLPRVRQDFADRWAPILGDPTIFFDYVFHCNADPNPTGEQAFQACCTGPVFARRPLETFVPNLPATVGLSVIYGERTWMNTESGAAMVQHAAQKRGANAQSEIDFVPNAGHQVNTDNVSGFNDALCRALRFV